MLSNETIAQDVRALCEKRGVKGGVSIALLSPESALDLAAGSADSEGNPLTPRHWLQQGCALPWGPAGRQGGSSYPRLRPPAPC